MEKIKKKYPEILSYIIASRVSETELSDYLDPKIKDLLGNPYNIPQMEEAVQKTVEIINQGKKIGILADYDVDGAASAALFIRFFRELGIELEVYIPNRLTEGYGPNKKAMDYMKEKQISALFIMDCGTSNIEILEYGQSIGLDLLVLDHHLYNEQLSNAAIIVNPNAHKDLPKDFHNLCAAGVTYLFLIMLNKQLKIEGVQKAEKIDLLSFLDVVALATVCDIMPLKGLNKAFVKHGLKIINTKNHLGVNALFNIASINDKINAQHLGFVVGPRINAGGRIGRSELGYQILSTVDEKAATDLAVHLDQLNKERREIQNRILDEAIDCIEQNQLNQNPILLIGQESWHSGVTGIVASRIKDIYKKPALVVAFDSDIGQGSARSPKGISIGEILTQSVKEGYLVTGGGHASAGGFKIESHKMQDFYQYLIDHLSSQSMPEVALDIDVELENFAFLDLNLLEQLEMLEPYGCENPEPKFLVHDVSIESFRVLKDHHVKCFFRDSQGNTLEGICFDASKKGMIDHLCQTHLDIDLVFTLQRNSWNNHVSLSLHIIDLNIK